MIWSGCLEKGYIWRMGALSRTGAHWQYSKKILRSKSGIILSGKRKFVTIGGSWNFNLIVNQPFHDRSSLPPPSSPFPMQDTFNLNVGEPPLTKEKSFILKKSSSLYYKPQNIWEGSFSLCTWCMLIQNKIIMAWQ